jgi:hypothetical protein
MMAKPSQAAARLRSQTRWRTQGRRGEGERGRGGDGEMGRHGDTVTKKKRRVEWLTILIFTHLIPMKPLAQQIAL